MGSAHCGANWPPQKQTVHLFLPFMRACTLLSVNEYSVALHSKFVARVDLRTTCAVAALAMKRVKQKRLTKTGAKSSL